MSKAYLITGSTVVNEGQIFRALVRIEKGKIFKILKEGEYDENLLRNGNEEITVIDGTGKYLLPGVIDDQVHFRDPGLTQKGDLYTESRAAVAGGITSFMDMPNTIPQTTTLELLEEKMNNASQRSLANYSFFLGATNSNLDQVEKADPRRICGIKVFMGSSTGNMLVDDPAALEKIFEKAPGIVAIHSEDEGIIRKNLEEYKVRYGENIPVEAHPFIRSEKSCFTSSLKAVTLAEKHRTRLHILHLSSAGELELLRNDLPLEDKKITAEVCVHHLWFSDRDYATLGSRIKWNPPVRSESNREELLRALLDGRIDILATDHAPHLAEEKLKPYLSCPSGGPLVQHSLPAMLELFHKGKISLEKIVEKMSHNPAILYRIKDRGFIRKGYYADLVLVDLNDPWEVTPANILYKCGWSPFEGTRFTSRITHTFVNGNLVYENGAFRESEKGQRLEFN